MNIIKVLSFAGAILFGIFIFVYGGWDDSPGAQLLGVFIVIGSIVGIIKDRKKTPPTQ